MARDHDDLRRILHFADSLEHLESVDSWQPNIEQNHVEAALSQQFETIFAARAGAGLVPFVLEDAAQRFADTGFVVDDKNVCHIQLETPGLLAFVAHRIRVQLAAEAPIVSGATGNSITKRLPNGLFSSTRMDPRWSSTILL